MWLTLDTLEHITVDNIMRHITWLRIQLRDLWYHVTLVMLVTVYSSIYLYGRCHLSKQITCNLFPSISPIGGGRQLFQWGPDHRHTSTCGHDPGKHSGRNPRTAVADKSLQEQLSFLHRVCISKHSFRLLVWVCDFRVCVRQGINTQFTARRKEICQTSWQSKKSSTGPVCEMLVLVKAAKEKSGNIYSDKQILDTQP